jgi:hypothetical protein
MKDIYILIQMETSGFIRAGVSRVSFRLFAEGGVLLLWKLQKSL